jgi:hypothetical protein
VVAQDGTFALKFPKKFALGTAFISLTVTTNDGRPSSRRPCGRNAGGRQVLLSVMGRWLKNPPSLASTTTAATGRLPSPAWCR